MTAYTGLAGPARAQEPTLAGMDRAAWTARDGAPQGVKALAQGQDGTLWVGTYGGLFNFDGHSFTACQSPVGEPELLAETVRSLLATRDGALWIGFLQSGMVRIARGHVTTYGTSDKLPRLTAIDQFRESRDGTVWAIANQTTLIRFARGDTGWRVEPMPPEVAKTRASGAYVDRYVLWLSGSHRARAGSAPARRERTWQQGHRQSDRPFYGDGEGAPRERLPEARCQGPRTRSDHRDSTRFSFISRSN